jgi:copper homeostasis protein (lipoprotein)
MRLPILLLAAVGLLAPGCTRRAAPPPPAPPSTPAPRASDLPRVGRFVGLLPCADCSGIQTELTLAGDWEGRSLFHLTETYVDGPNAKRTIQSAGTWITLRGTAEDASAVVYHLDTDPPGASRSFVVVDERQIRLLGPGLESLPSSLPATLTRVDGR